MKNKLVTWVFLAIGVAVTLFSTGCRSHVPQSYPQIELPPPGNQSTANVVDDIVSVPPAKTWHKTIDIPATISGVKMLGWCVASGGARNDIKVLVLNDIDFYNWKNFNPVKGLYQSEKSTVATIEIEIPKPGRYHLVFSNWFSEFSSKEVIAKVYLYWTISPVNLEFGEKNPPVGTVQIPANADVTLALGNESLAHSFQASQNVLMGTPVFIKLSGKSLNFAAPSKGDYEFTYGIAPQSVKVKFHIIPSAPSIGRELMLDSAQANAPPVLNKTGDRSVGVNQKIEFTIEAQDADDDPLSIYAANLPPGAVFDETTQTFKWTPAYPGKYFIHFEVSDGALRDSENIVIKVE
jgi:hypothetical protein